MVRASDQIATPDPDWDAANPDPATGNAPIRIYNIGNNDPTALMVYLEAIEEALGKKPIRELLPLQPGDVPYVCRCDHARSRHGLSTRHARERRAWGGCEVGSEFYGV